MSSEALKAELDWIKVSYASSLAMDAALLSWIVSHYETAHIYVLIYVLSAAVITFFGLLVLTVRLNNKAYQLIEQMKREHAP